MDTIHCGFASEGETMAARMKHAKEAEVDAMNISNPKVLDLLDIVFTKHDV